MGSVKRNYDYGMKSKIITNKTSIICTRCIHVRCSILPGNYVETCLPVCRIEIVPITDQGLDLLKATVSPK